MAKKIRDAEGNVYKELVTTDKNRKRTLEIIIGVIAMILSVIFIGGSFGAAAVADAFGGDGYYTAKMMLGLILAIISFVLVFFINKNRKVIGWSIAIMGAIILFMCGDYGIVPGIFYVIDGILVLVRK
ncbi:hypothetical protein H5S09_02920 [Limosilactobacillus sp. STM2_1]|uniref:DUF4064 domain-containing protein n=1 Tax=Limosilactobacillus rudii TaxID=2759755 RepID=A0A7W3YMB4_9LACO|nr:hypothetical protein [Limosilactobacillus rudii]MBB1080193.1 hypothetical protein [Limosilactobacillus rudii]MBB1096903.1 hypothetical protein [Limosilactobacillus rudii]MCD7133801.1 hypothetical protein [Limosilactobacillus rudii]